MFLFCFIVYLLYYYFFFTMTMFIIDQNVDYVICVNTILFELLTFV